MTADAEEAARLFREADRLERRRPIDFSAVTLNPLEAERLREKGKQLLARPSDLTGAAGTELVPAPAADERLTDARMELLETLNAPNTIDVASSEQRALLATRAGVLPAAIDAAVSAQAQGPIERSLAVWIGHSGAALTRPSVSHPGYRAAVLCPVSSIVSDRPMTAHAVPDCEIH